MGRRGRPPKPGRAVHISIHLVLREGEDDDLLRIFESCPPGRRARLVRMALRGADLRAAVAGLGGPSEEEIREALRTLDNLFV